MGKAKLRQRKVGGLAVSVLTLCLSGWIWKERTATGPPEDRNPSKFIYLRFFFGLQGLFSLFFHHLDDFIQVCRRGDLRDSEVNAIPEVKLSAGFKHVSKAWVMKHDRSAYSKIQLCTQPLPYTIICLPVILELEVLGFCAPPGGGISLRSALVFST